MQDVKTILLVGGMGTRLRSVLPSKPKVLAPVGDRSFLELVVRQLRSQRIRHLVMCTGYLANQIDSQFCDGRMWDVSIEYSVEEAPLGTAGAIKWARDHLTDVSELLVPNGNSFLEVNFHGLVAFHRWPHHAVVTLAVLRVKDASRYGTVRVDASNRVIVIGYAEKTATDSPGPVNGGGYVCSQTVWQHIPEGPATLKETSFPI